MEPDWSLWVHDLAGNPIQRVDWASGSQDPFTASSSGDGQSTFTVTTNDDEAPWAPGQIANLFYPHQRFLVRWWGVNGGAHPNDFIMAAHKVEGYDYPRDDGTVTVQAVDLMGELPWRMIGGVDASKDLTLEIVGRNASGAVRQTLARMMQWGPEWVYPIDLPADGAGDFSRTYKFWEGFSISEIFQDIRERTGAEVSLRPYSTPSGGVRFETLVGSPITLGATKFNLDAAETPLSGIKYRVDASQQVTGILGIGNGTGPDQEMRWAGGGPFPIPIRDTKKSFRDMAGDGLQQAANRHLEANRYPIVQWDIGAFTIDADYSPELVAPGRVLHLEIYGDPVIPDGVHTLRVMSVSGDNGRQLKPEVQSA